MASCIGDPVFLSRDNYSKWKVFITRVLESEGLKNWLSAPSVPEEDKITSAFDKYKLAQHKQRAAALLKSYLTPEVELAVQDFDDPATVWSTLKLNFEVTGRAQKAQALIEFHNIKMGSDEELPTFITRFENAYKKLKEAGEDVTESHRIYKLIQNLPIEYDYLAREFDKMPDDNFKFDNIKSEIIKEFNRKELRDRQLNESFTANQPSTSKIDSERSQRTVPKMGIRCRKCDRTGHLAHECQTYSRGGKSYIAELLNDKCYASEILPASWEWTLDSASTSHIAQNREFFASLKPPPPNMVVRMGTTPHVVRGIGNISFHVRDKGKIKQVNLMNVLYVPSIHRNLISMSKMDKAGYHAKLNNGFLIYDPKWRYQYTANLKNQFYVLKALKPKRMKIDRDISPIKSDMNKQTKTGHLPKKAEQPKLCSEKCVSFASLAGTKEIKPRGASYRESPLDKSADQSHSSATEFTNTEVKTLAKPPQKVTFSSKSQDNLHESYTTDKHSFKTSATYNEVYANEKNNIMLWHDRLGHINVDYIKKMFNENLVKPCGNLQGKAVRCEPCILAKSTRAPHQRLSAIRSRDLLELIHADVWGPAPVASRNGHRYLLTCIDDYSRRAFCFPLRTKDEVMNRIANFITFVERQTGKKVKVLRSDNGLEFCNHALENYLQKLGIKHERTSIASPQMNGCAERYNRLLFEGVRTFKFAANLPDKLWTEAVMAINYIKNRVWHATIEAIPFSRWYNTKPTLKHLKRYGCVAYVHQPKERRTSKFQPRAKRGILVGYGLSTSGYRIWFPQENTIVESKHVTFDESQIGRPLVPNQPSRSFLLNDLEESSLVPLQVSDEKLYPSIDDQMEIQPGPSTGLDDAAKDGIFRSFVPDIKEETSPSVTDGGSQSDTSPTESEDESKDIDWSADPGKVKFIRYQVKRKKGKTKGQIDTYIKTPEGTKLRSDRNLKIYCKENKIEYNDEIANFSKSNTYQGPILMNKYMGDSEREEAFCAEVIIPRSPKHARQLPEAAKWQEAMDCEINTMLERKVWTPVPYDKEYKIIGTRWVYTTKKNAQGEIPAFKARLVALGNLQKKGPDYQETFSPVINFTLIRLFMILFSCILKWVNCLLDVRCAYLYGKIDKNIYMRQPDGYKLKGKENYVLKLNKAIYGLHQSGCCWHNDLREKLLSNGFQEIRGVTCAFTYQNKAIVLVYVDDLPIFAQDQETLDEVIKLIESIYEVKHLGSITLLLGVEFLRKEGQLFNLNCAQYISKCLKKYEIYDETHVTLPSTPGFQPAPCSQEAELLPEIPFRNLLRSLQYIAQRCRPDVAWTVAALSQYTEKYDSTHFSALFKILMYLGTTKELGLIYQETK